MKGSRGHYHALPLIASPLQGEGEEEHEHGHGHDDHVEHAYTPPVESKGLAHEEVSPLEDDVPVFRSKEEASTIELFYDLFFVANLTSFTNVHPIADHKGMLHHAIFFPLKKKGEKLIYFTPAIAIASYMGFFSILWFTWLQVVLYDVRFGVDSLYERICKLVHFGVMVTFAVVGTKFDPSAKDGSNFTTLRQLSLILIVSRLILILQYGSILFWVKGHKKILPPILTTMIAFTLGALITLGIFFSFKQDGSGRRAYIGWYVIGVSEAILVFVSSSVWRSISFKRTNLNERCGLLTLIILGEGIIVLTKAVNGQVDGMSFPKSVLAQIISATLIIVFYPNPPPSSWSTCLVFSKFGPLMYRSILSTCCISIRSIISALVPFGSNSGLFAISPSTCLLCYSWKELVALLPGETRSK